MHNLDQGKSPQVSQVEMTQLVLPSDANSLGNAFGGKIMQWIDVAAGVAARRHAGMVAVTAAMDSMQFHCPIKLGDVVVLRSRVNRAWRTSMEVGVKVEYETEGQQQKIHAASAYLTFVAIDQNGRPHPVPPIIPQTAEDNIRYQAAEKRRQQRLQLLKDLKSKQRK